MKDLLQNEKTSAILDHVCTPIETSGGAEAPPPDDHLAAETIIDFSAEWNLHAVRSDFELRKAVGLSHLAVDETGFAVFSAEVLGTLLGVFADRLHGDFAELGSFDLFHVDTRQHSGFVRDIRPVGITVSAVTIHEDFATIEG